jgi:hypothetical protein
MTTSYMDVHIKDVVDQLHTERFREALRHGKYMYDVDKIIRGIDEAVSHLRAVGAAYEFGNARQEKDELSRRARLRALRSAREVIIHAHSDATVDEIEQATERARADHTALLKQRADKAE